jgi:tetratricopeptide (TPR) repeat protein
MLAKLVDALNNLVRRETAQTASLERIEEQIEHTQETQEANREAWTTWLTRFILAREAGWRLWMVQLTVRVVAVVLGISAFWGFMGWYIDRIEIVRMAQTYCDTAVQVYEEEENATVALELLDKAVELNGNDSEIRFQRAFIGGMAVVRDLFNLDRPVNREELDRAHGALAQARMLQRLRPKSPESHILSSQIYTALKKFDTAESEMSKALELASDNPLVRWRHAALLMEQVRNDQKKVLDHAAMLAEAEKELDAALELSRKPKVHSSLFDASLTSLVVRPFVSLQSGLEEGRLDKMIFLWKGVLEAEHRKNYAKARDYYTEALKSDPGFSLALSSRGIAWISGGTKDLAKAKEDFLQALETDPNCVQAYYGLGMVYGYQDRYETAKSYFDKGLAINDSALRLLKWRGIVNTEMQQWDAALEDYDKALDLNPADYELYVRKAKVLEKTGKTQEAISDLLFAEELNPDNPDIAYNLGNIYLGLGDTDRALARYGSALKQKPTFDDCWAAQADALAKANRMDEALESLNQAVACAKQQSERFLLRRGVLEQAMGRKEPALADFQAAREKDEKLAPAWWGEAQVLADLGRAEEARAALESYINLHPDDPEARLLQERLK